MNIQNITGDPPLLQYLQQHGYTITTQGELISPYGESLTNYVGKLDSAPKNHTELPPPNQSESNIDLSELSIRSQMIIKAYNKGYRVTKSGKYVNPKGERLITPQQKGYLMCPFRNHNKKLRYFPLHRLQAYQKFGMDMFKPGIVVRHLNNDPLNNSYDNIGIGTDRDNAFDRPAQERREHAIRTSRAWQNTTRSVEEREAIYQARLDGMSYNQIMRQFGVSSKGTLSFMFNKSIEFKEYAERVKKAKSKPKPQTASVSTPPVHSPNMSETLSEI